MYQINDYVIYGKYSVCKVEDICSPPFEGVENDMKYYVLKPIGIKGSTLYTPVENSKVSLRNIMTKEEAMELIHKVPNLKTIIVENEKYRETSYRNLIQKGDSEELIKIMKTIYSRKEACLAVGKKMSSTDEKYLRQAEENLFEELSYSFELSKEEVKDYYNQQVNQLENI